MKVQKGLGYEYLSISVKLEYPITSRSFCKYAKIVQVGACKYAKLQVEGYKHAKILQVGAYKYANSST